MKRLILLLAATSLAASPAVAQHQGHNMPGMTMPVPSKKPPVKKKPAAKKPATKGAHAKKAAAKKPGAKRTTAKRSAAKKEPVKKPSTRSGSEPATDLHAGHQMAVEPTVADPHAGHDVSTMPETEQPEQQPDPHASHTMPAEPQAQPADEHAGHDASATVADVPVGPPPAEALQGPENAADTAWGRGAMEHGRAVLFAEHGHMLGSKVLIDQLETRFQDGRNGYFLNAEGWYGGDIDKLWLKSEIEGAIGRKPEKAEIQALWSHAIDPWFDLQAGIRLDAEPDTRGRLVLGLQGLAPYWIEVDVAAFLSDRGDLTARAEAEHDVRITRKLILQPRAEFDFSLQDIPREQIGSGLSTAELGLRLRYEIVPNFAPYIGIKYERAFGKTRRFVRADGDDPGSVGFVMGLRTWF